MAKHVLARGRRSSANVALSFSVCVGCRSVSSLCPSIWCEALRTKATQSSQEELVDICAIAMTARSPTLHSDMNQSAEPNCNFGAITPN